MTTSTTWRRWFRFSLRTLLLVILISAVPIGWLTARVRYERRQQATLAPWREMGRVSAWNYDDDKRRLRMVALEPTKSVLTDRERSSFNTLGRLRLGGPMVTDAWLANFRGADQLRFLELDGTGIGDAGLAHVATLRGLESLSLNQTAVTDAGMKHLTALSNLRDVQLYKTGISDKGLLELVPLKKLGALGLEGTRVTKKGAAEYRRRRHADETIVVWLGP